MAESGSPWQTHRTFLKYRAKQKRTALIRHCRWHKIPQTDNWVFPKCPRQLRSRAPGEPPKGESSTLSRADRTRDVKGTGVSVRVDLGGRRVITKKKTTNQ